MGWKKINNIKDLPEFGRYVLVSGIDKGQYGKRAMHVCCVDDLEDGMQFKETGEFYWLTEKGTKIEEVSFWRELPSEPSDNKQTIFM